jgi:hypothetical protein
MEVRCHLAHIDFPWPQPYATAGCKSFKPKEQWQRATSITTVDKFFYWEKYLTKITKLSHSVH